MPELLSHWFPAGDADTSECALARPVFSPRSWSKGLGGGSQTPSRSVRLALPKHFGNMLKLLDLQTSLGSASFPNWVYLTLALSYRFKEKFEMVAGSRFELTP